MRSLKFVCAVVLFFVVFVKASSAQDVGYKRFYDDYMAAIHAPMLSNEAALNKLADVRVQMYLDDRGIRKMHLDTDTLKQSLTVYLQRAGITVDEKSSNTLLVSFLFGQTSNEDHTVIYSSEYVSEIKVITPQVLFTKSGFQMKNVPIWESGIALFTRPESELTERNLEDVGGYMLRAFEDAYTHANE
jgi:hypothetical protein